MYRLEVDRFFVKRFFAMARTVRSINLLPSNENNLLAQFLNWALTVGRLLIILVETLALTVFIYRFTLDRQLSDLHDTIKAKSQQVQYAKDSETQFRNLQQRLSSIKQYDAIASVTPTLFRDIVEMGRSIVTFKSILVSSESVKIEVAARSPGSIAKFIDKLKIYPQIASVSIDSVANNTSTAFITVGMTAVLRPGANTVAMPTPTVNQTSDGSLD